MTMPTMFGMVARRQMEQYGATPEDFAQVSAKNHDNGCPNPQAQYKKQLTIEEGIEGNRRIRYDRFQSSLHPSGE
jgi:benzoylsuccinyl-CoA thiolase BbsB subunit